MNGFIKKLGSYQIMTNLLPGIFFGIGLKLLLGMTLPTQNTGEEIIVYYFMGLIINRISSLIVKPVLNKCIFIKEASYSNYVKASKIDPKIDVLSETNTHFRALLTSSLLLIITAILKILAYNNKWISLNWKWMLLIFLPILFLFAFKKQTNFICKRIESVTSLEKNKEPDYDVCGNPDNS
jgi:hypothetical protein